MYIFTFIFNMIASLFVLDFIRVSKLSGSVSEKRRKSLGRYRRLYVRAGLTKKADIVFYVYLPLASFPAGILIAILTGYAGGLFICIIPGLASMILLKVRRNRDAAMFRKNAYRIYKYVLNQIGAGVRPSDALVSMHEVIEDKELKEKFSKACAGYSLTFDSARLADDIAEGIESDEARTMAMTIGDGLFENRDSELLERLEQMMFHRYFAYIQKQTDSLRTRCLATVVLLCMVIVAMILIPTVMDVQKALDSIFM